MRGGRGVRAVPAGDRGRHDRPRTLRLQRRRRLRRRPDLRRRHRHPGDPGARGRPRAPGVRRRVRSRRRRARGGGRPRHRRARRTARPAPARPPRRRVRRRARRARRARRRARRRGGRAGAGGLGGPAELDRTAAAEARAMLDAGRTGELVIGAEGSRCGSPLTLLVESSVPPPRMIVFGAIDFAAALVRAGRFLGYRVTVCDARPVFATAARFPEADEIVVDWPHRYLAGTEVDARTVLCVLTHDPKFDVPLLELALRLPVAYVGAMGSRRTNDDREQRLRELGLTDEEIGRLSSPIGLDLGARTPEETAVSIAAEIIAGRWGGTGERLAGTDGPIHATADR